MAIDSGHEWRDDGRVGWGGVGEERQKRRPFTHVGPAMAVMGGGAGRGNDRRFHFHVRGIARASLASESYLESIL
jgi:hypothetical protein